MIDEGAGKSGPKRGQRHGPRARRGRAGIGDSRDGVTATPCPRCGKKLDAATAVDGKSRPREGDFSVCAYCSTRLRFDNRGALRPLEDAEYMALEPESKAELATAAALTEMFEFTRRRRA